MDGRPTPPSGYRTQSPDTAYWAETLEFDHLRTLGLEETARQVSGLCRSIFAAAERAVRARWRDAPPEILERLLAEMYLGEALAARALDRRPSREAPPAS